MDISPKILREVEFREKFRGYHPEDVDTFLERVAVGIEALQVQLRQATERAAHAERLASETGTTDEALSRTLLLAQRTADTAIEEAREQAARIVATAESQARIILEEASQRAQRVAEESQAALRAELAELESARDQLRGDVNALAVWVEDHRTALSDALSGLLRQLERGVRLRSAAPEVADVEIPPEPVVETPDVPTAESLAGAGAEAGQAGSSDSADAAAAGREDANEPSRAEAVAAAEDQPVEQQAVDVDEPDADERAAAEAGTVDADADASEAGAAAAGEDEAAGDGAAAGDEDDPFMAELRRAVTDTEPLGPRDESTAPAADDQPATPLQDDLDASRRFGSRLRKRR